MARRQFTLGHLLFASLVVLSIAIGAGTCVNNRHMPWWPNDEPPVWLSPEEPSNEGPTDEEVMESLKRFWESQPSAESALPSARSD